VFLSAVLGTVGAWLFAGRFTKSAAMKLFACAICAINGRWALQMSVGHMWHLYYAYVPWALYFYDRAASEAGRMRDTVLTGVVLALMVYAGAIYPLPQTVVCIGIYSILLAAQQRNVRPILRALLAGVLSFGFSAPKLLPVLDTLRRYPRLIDSPEALDLGGLILTLTHREGEPAGHPYPSPWGWHEWGIYIGWIAVAAIVIGLCFARGLRVSPLRWVALACLVLGLGSFHEKAPWTLMHELPIFKSQHVPSRWLYPAIICGAAAAAALAQRILVRTRFRMWIEALLLVPAILVANDVATNTAGIVAGTFNKRPASVVESMGAFYQNKVIPPELNYSDRDWAPAALPSMTANVGAIDCGTFPGLHNYVRDAQGHAPGLGAKGKGDENYHGEIYTLTGAGSAAFTRWTPNVMEVRVTGAKAGDLLVLNQNWDAGWLANGSPALMNQDLVAYRLNGADESVTFRYRPRTWWLGIGIFFLTIAALAVAPRVLVNPRARSPVHRAPAFPDTPFAPSR
jgi:hypothetical protein